MKKLFIFLAMSIFLINFGLAAEWDNSKDYDEVNREVTIRNWVIGPKIATVKLNTPLNFNVALGYQQVAEFEVNLFKDYENSFKELELYDLNSDFEKINREFEYKYQVVEEVLVNDYETICTSNQTCKEIKSGEHYEQRVVWKQLEEYNFEDGQKLIVGIFTNVEQGDVVEWIPNFFGVRIEEWAIWTQDLNVGLKFYYNFDNNAGTLLNDSLGVFNGTLVNMEDGDWRTEGCLIGNCLKFDGVDEFVNTTFNPNYSLTDNFSISFWINVTVLTAIEDKIPVGSTSGNNEFRFQGRADGGYRGRFGDNGATVTNVDPATNLSDGTWHHIIIVRDTASDEFRYYADGVSVVNVTDGSTTNIDLSAKAFYLGAGNLAGTAANHLNVTMDEFGMWNRTLNVEEVAQLYNDGNGITFSGFITLNTPTNNQIFVDSSIEFNCAIGGGGPLISNLSLVLDNVIVQTNSSGLLDSDYLFTQTVSDGLHNWTCNAVLTQTNININASVQNFTLTSFIQNSTAFKAQTFETKGEVFSVNITTNGSVPTSPKITYNGITTTATILNTNNNDYNISANLAVPVGAGVKDFNFNFTLDGLNFNTSLQMQTVNLLDFNFCNASLNVPYINFTFKNETVNEENVSATIDSTWNVFLNTSTTFKKFNLVNNTENFNYSICSSASNDTLFTNLSMTYNNAVSQQRAFTSEPILTNSTIVQILYLLPSPLGLFQSFQVRDIANNPIPGARGIISRTLGSSTITVDSRLTDSSGLAIYFLNPDITYTGSFSSSGFSDVTFTFVPTTDIRFVTMGTGATVNGSNISIGTNYDITPTNSSITNNTLVTFGFNVTGNEAITFISMNLTNSSGFSWAFQSNAGTGFITQVLNTSKNSSIIGRFEIRTGEETLTFTKIWIIGNEFEGDYSILKQGKLFIDYEFSDFIRLLIVILTMFALVIFMSKNELADNSESKVAVIIILVWIFSLMGWLDNPSVVSQTGIAQFSKQYGIAILTTIGGLFFFMRRTFR